MAGGSADAAAALVACDQLWGLAHPATRTCWSWPPSSAATCRSRWSAAPRIGSGRGEMVTPLMTRGEYWWVVLPESDEGLSTPAVYREFDALHGEHRGARAELPDG